MPTKRLRGSVPPAGLGTAAMSHLSGNTHAQGNAGGTGNPHMKRPNQTTGLTTVEAQAHYRIVWAGPGL